MKRILVIEDDPEIQSWLVQCLEKIPYGVLAASDGLAGYELAKKEKIDLVVLDHDLPGKNGREICRSLRQEGIRTPILMLTDKGGQTDKVLTLGMGADDYMTKPFGTREFLARISTLLKRKQELDSAVDQAAEFTRELETARSVQEKLFPRKLPAHKSWDFAALCRPARAVGGDYYDLFEAAPGKVLMALGDVSGKGLGPSLLMAGVQATIKSRAGACLENPLALIAEVNRNLLFSSSPEDFLTLFLGILDLDNGQLTYANCGHPPPLLFRQENPEPERLAEGGTVLGALEECPCSLGRCQLNSGDVLALFSDGLTEAANEAGEMFEEEKLIQVLREIGEQSAAPLLNEILGAVERFAAEAEQRDDISLMVIHRSF
ncbi:MAG: SpoIIE family protein phosphatase [Candidatus Zixiibacteriota bacterium]